MLTLSFGVLSGCEEMFYNILRPSKLNSHAER